MKIKNNFNKFLAVSVLALVMVLLAGTYAVGNIRAEDLDNYPSIVQKIAERFGLNQEEVQGVFDEYREEKHTVMQTHFQDQLSQAVADGKITEEQKQAILAKKDELRAKHTELKSLTWEEKKEAMNALKTEIQAWAEENGIDPSFLFGMHGGYKGFGGHGYHGGWGKF